MNVLFVTLFPLENNTSVTISNYGLLMGLHALGYEVTILEPSMSRAGTYRCDYDLSMFTIERIPELYFNELRRWGNKTFVERVQRKWHKEFDFLDFTAPMLKYADKVAVEGKKYDIIISTSDPKTTHLFVKRLIERGLQYGRWIQHWGDPMNGDITRKNCYPDRIIQWYERKIIEKADRIVYVSPFTTEMQRKAYPDMVDKIAFVPLPCIESENERSSSKNGSEHLKLAYMGDYFSKVRNIMPLYEACQSMPEVELTIAGISDLKLQSTGNITVLPRVPHSQAVQIEEQADVSVSVCNIRGTQIPGKLYYSAAMQKHLMVLIDGDDPEKIKTYLERFNRYELAENNVESIKTAIKELQGKPCDYQCPEELKPLNVIKAILD